MAASKRKPVVQETVTPFEDTPFKPWKPEVPVEAPKAKETVEPVPLTTSLYNSIETIILKLPAKERPAARTDLQHGVQDFITKLKAQLETDKSKEIVEIREALVTRAKQEISEKIKEVSEAAGPTNPTEMQTLVGQDYLSFTIKIPVTVEGVDHEEESYKDRAFVITEMVQSSEKKVMHLVTRQLPKMLQNLQGVTFSPGSSNMEKINKAIGIVPDIADLLCEATAICLNPRGKNEVDGKWVAEHCSTARMMMILEAQFMASRIRDFFLAVSRVMPKN